MSSNRKYFVEPTRKHGFWIVALNDAGHYRNVGKYSQYTAAVNAAERLNAHTQSADSYSNIVMQTIGVI